ncbi:MAG: TolC family protein [Gemmatimonadota bacterium]
MRGPAASRRPAGPQAGHPVRPSAAGRAALAALSALAVLPLVARPLAAQEPRPLSLAAAIREARRGNPDARVASARAIAADAKATGSLAGLLPSVSFGSGVTRSVDPVFAFGTKLRQGRFGQPDFAPDVLNDPDPQTDWTGTAEVRWPVLSPAALGARAAASRRADAAGWSAVRSGEAAALGAETLYLEAMQTGAALEAAEEAEASARATRDVFARRVERGLLTRADLLQAESEVSAAEARRIDAVRTERDALQALALYLGWEPDVVPVLTDSLAGADPVAGVDGPRHGEEPDTFDAASRSDLRQLAAARDAARADRTRARLSYLPELTAFAGWAAHGTRAFSSDATDWTIGIGLRWSPFSGLARIAEARRSSAAEQVAEIRYDEALRRARAEVSAASRAAAAADGRLAAASAARAAAEAGDALMRRRFEEGLATASDVLASQARLASARAREIDARADVRLAAARLRFVQNDHPEEALP